MLLKSEDVLLLAQFHFHLSSEGWTVVHLKLPTISIPAIYVMNWIIIPLRITFPYAYSLSVTAWSWCRKNLLKKPRHLPIFLTLTTVGLYSGCFLVLQLNGTELFNFVDRYQSWDDYLRNMSQEGTWGDNVILHAVANCFHTCIDVVSLTHHQDLRITPEHDVDSNNQLVLGHTHELHYVSLRPTKPGKQTCAPQS